MLATSSDNTTVATVVFQVFPVLDGEIIDMTSGISATATIRFITDNHTTNDATWAKTLLTLERSDADLLEDDEVIEIVVTVPTAASVIAYDKFTVQIVPQKGAPITISRKLRGAVDTVNNLN